MPCGWAWEWGTLQSDTPKAATTHTLLGMESAPTPARRLRRKIVSIQVLPTMITSANLLVGLLAISYLMDAAAAAAEAALLTDTIAKDAALAAHDNFLLRAGWLIFAGMFCDALDGRIARLTNSTSSFGAQLDSLADVVTFGVTPALLARAQLGYAFEGIAGKVLVGLAVVYILGAALRLARYNVETARLEESGTGHVTRIFRGLPSPAAAGVIASLVVLRYSSNYAWTNASLDWVLLALTPILGLFMVSRMPFAHVLNLWLDGRRPLGTVVMFGALVFFTALYFEETMAAVFLLYALSGPVALGLHRLTGWPSWVEQEDEDEEEAEPGTSPTLELHPRARGAGGDAP